MTTDQLLTPTRITGWLACAHTMTLQREVDAGVRPEPEPMFGSFAHLLREKGDAHERAHLDRLRAEGRDVLQVPRRQDDETFAQWAARVRPLLAEGHDVLYQFPLVHDGIRGVADFLERVDTPSDLGEFSYEPVDAKLARHDAKPGHLLQLCFYADAIAAAQGVRPQSVHLELGSGERESVALATVDAYWRRARRQLDRALADPTPTVARPCTHCDQCAFAAVCTAEWRGRDALHYVAGIRSAEVEHLATTGITTLTGLAGTSTDVEGLKPERTEHLRRQAALQIASREHEVPLHELLERPEDGSPEELAARVPEPDEGDVFLDLEGHPYWRADTGLFFLFGALVRDPDADGGWTYRAWWAHDEAGEARAVDALIAWLAERRLAHPGMHVLHYNHTERSVLLSLAARYSARPETLHALVEQGVFVDLLEVVRRTVRIGGESLSLKVVERVARYERDHEIDAGAGAVVSYERWMREGDDAELTAIARYNEDDVRATLAVRDWLMREVLDGVPARPMPEPKPIEESELEAVAAELRATGVAWHALLGDLLGYWSREGRTVRAQAVAQLDGEEADHLRRAAVVGGLELVRFEEPSGRRKHGSAVFRYPEQRFEARVRGGRRPSLIFPSPTDPWPITVSVRDHDEELREFELAWPEAAGDPQYHPSAMATVQLQNAVPKSDALLAFARRVLDGELRPSDAARVALLKRQLPALVDGEDVPQPFPVDPVALADVVDRLAPSAFAVQGPPGTGKTHTGARLIVELVRRGRRVGVTAFSHAAIDNLLAEIVEVDADVRILRQEHPKGHTVPVALAGITLHGKVAEAWDPTRYDVIAGTTWPMTTLSDTDEPSLDLLVIDEAGQLGLADALAAMGCARGTLLLGDPLQLAQVTKAVHPGGAGRSTLEHVLDDAATLPEDRGVFLPVTRRMHPAITSVLSEQVYEGRLTAHEDCATHAVDGRSGVRWIRAQHEGRSTESPEEAELVCQLARSLIGTPWTDSRNGEGGETVPLPAERIMVITPYNDHVDLVRGMLDDDPVTRGVRVGTVDRLQGQEAAVVLYSMATSSGADMTRGVDFLFQRNRLNVAVSRARALAYIICTDELLDTRAAAVRDMQLIGTLCAVVEAAGDPIDIP